MASNNYYYLDDDECKFVPVEYSTAEKIIFNASLWLICGVIFAGVVIIGLSKVAGTPSEIALQAENHALYKRLNKTKASIKLMNHQLNQLADTDNNLYRSILGMHPLSKGELEAGVGGADIYSKYDIYSQKTSNLLKWTASNIASIQRKINVQKVSFKEIKAYYNHNKKRLAHMPVIRPVKGIILSGFGMRYHPIYHFKRMHYGVDFRASVGTPIYATGDGTITYAKRMGTYGNLIEINHGFGFQTRYAHLSAFAKGIHPGVKVKRGQLIGYTGATGVVTGPHLHYEIRIHGKPVNPIYYFFGDLTPQQYNEFKKIASENTKAMD
ncbi:MAG TPA: M23 family metallopeptidase [Balneolales bacterium]|nr:M23 family metallopeptidase [Balneolales bacterium]